MRPFISIIIPMYNCEKYISKNINSILNQSYSNFELIIINDGSVDKSLEIVNQFNDKRIKIIDKNNEGVSKTRNLGIDMANGEYLFFIDADDYIEKDTLKKFVYVINKFNPDLIMCGIYHETYKYNSYTKFNFTEKFYKNQKYFKQDIVNLYDNNLLYNVWNKIFKKNIILKNNIRFPDINYGEDLIFNQQYFKCCNTFYNIEDCLYHYIREVKNSITTGYVPNLFDIRLKENSIFIDFFNDYGIKYDNYINFVAKRFIGGTISCLENIHRKNDLKIHDKYKEVKKIIYHNETIKYLNICNNNLKIKLILITYKLPITVFFTGLLLHIYKVIAPNSFNKVKNKR